MPARALPPIACFIAARRRQEESEARKRREYEARKSKNECKCKCREVIREYTTDEEKYIREQRVVHQENLKAHQDQMRLVSNIVVGGCLILMVVLIYMLWKEGDEV